jgi:hypothetical protein
MNTSKILKKLLMATTGGVVIALALQPLAKAATLTILAGDKDCFGLGGLCADGTLWRDDLGGQFGKDYGNGNDPNFTDKWFSGSGITYNHSYSFNGETPIYAELEIKTVGLADNHRRINNLSSWDISFNSQRIGEFTANNSLNSFQEQVTHIFSIPINLLTGSDKIFLDINNQTLVDGYSIDYSELRITTKAKTLPEVVPEPDSIMGFLACGIFGTIYWLKRKRR